MLEFLAMVAIVLYAFFASWLLFANIMQLHLLRLSRKSRQPASAGVFPDFVPFITIQVPVYNERFVITRLLDSLGVLDYPKDRFEIQVLDDSTDDTPKIIAEHLTGLASQGLAVHHLRRQDRTGYKAGALQAALPKARGEFITVFDADFTPAPDYLSRAVRHFTDSKVGCVQGRWLHRNQRESWLTVIQSFLLDIHFNVEQDGRQQAGYFVSFNGTAGMWRRGCIEDLGGWNGAMLTEDLDLSYRAQIRGWKVSYDGALTVPADLPTQMTAFKSQLFRWSKGLAQCFVQQRKNVWNMRAPLSTRLHAIYHLLSSFTFVALTGQILLVLPLMIGRHYSAEYAGYTRVLMLTGITFPAMCALFYFGARRTLSQAAFWANLPIFFLTYLALSTQNTVAVIQGWLGIATPFVRTPKPDERQIAYEDKANKTTWLPVLEWMMLLYVCISILICIIWKDLFFLVFLLMVLAGQLLLLTKPLPMPQATGRNRLPLVTR